MTDDWFENNKEFYNYLIKNMVYCEDAHSVAHRLYDKILEKVIKKINDQLDEHTKCGPMFAVDEEELDTQISYKDAQYMMYDVLNEMADEFKKGNKNGNV